MNIHADTTQNNKSQATANSLPKQQGNNEPSSQLQEMVKDSPQVKQLRAYQEMANSSSQVRQLKAYQQMANASAKPPTVVQRKEIDINVLSDKPKIITHKTEAQNKPVVQRAVITVNADGLISDSAQTVANVTGATAGAFDEVENGETIYIFAHGYHSMTRPITEQDPTTNLEPMLIGGITAPQLCQMMIEEGWSKKHTGDIDIRACMSGAESMLPSFAELFATELKRLGRPNLVTGYKHLTKTENNGTETAMKPTIAKMIDVAQKFDPKNLQHRFFAMDVTNLYESRIPGLLEERKKFNVLGAKFKQMKGLIIGTPPEGSGMATEEWNVYSYYHAVETENTDLALELKKDFSQTNHLIDKAVGGAHGRTFDPADMPGQDVD